MSDEYKDANDEIVKRTRRLETKMTKIALRLGVDATPEKERVTLHGNVLDLSGLDVSLGDLLDVCRKNGISGKVTLVCGGLLVGYFQLGDHAAWAAQEQRKG